MALEQFMDLNGFSRKERLNSLMDCTALAALNKPGASRVRSNSGRALHCQCTVCGITSLPVHEVLRHPVVSHGALVIPVCSDCINVVQPLSQQGLQNSLLCSWCGATKTESKVSTCNSCPRVFCHDCINKHFGVVVLQNTKKEVAANNWSCYSCNVSLLEGKDWLTLGSETRVVRKTTASGRPIAASCNHCKQPCLSTPGRKFYVCTNEQCNMQGSHSKRRPDKVTVRLNCSRCLTNHFEEPADPVKSSFICVDCRGIRCVHGSSCKYYKSNPSKMNR